MIFPSINRPNIECVFLDFLQDPSLAFLAFRFLAILTRKVPESTQQSPLTYLFLTPTFIHSEDPVKTASESRPRRLLCRPLLLCESCCHFVICLCCFVISSHLFCLCGELVVCFARFSRSWKLFFTNSGKKHFRCYADAWRRPRCVQLRAWDVMGTVLLQAPFPWCYQTHALPSETSEPH